MKQLLIIPAIALAACTPPPQQCGPTEEVEILLTKEGFPIINDQAPIPFPCSTVSITTSPDASDTPEPPVSEPPMTPEPPFMPPVAKVKGKHPNSGRGNGSELDNDETDVDPGNSGKFNRGGD